MTDFTAISNYNRAEPVKRKSRWPLYLGLGIAANALVWGAAIAYITLKSPSYSSKWAVSLPGVSSMTKVDVPGIGGASSQTDSPYKNESHDPRENYKFIAESKQVLSAAAQEANLPPEEFGEPQIEIVGNTTLMEFEIDGDTPELAYQKAIAIQKALEGRLNELRTEEMSEQDRSLQMLLSRSKQNLEQAQRRLSDYKARSNISSPEQVRDLSVNVENLRRQQAELEAQQQQSNARMMQLGTNLGLSPQQANDAFMLQSDPLFQDYLLKYKTASAEWVSLNSIYKAGHPQMIAKQKEIDDARSALIRRSEEILDKPVSPSTWEGTLAVGNSSNTATNRQNLMQELVSVQAENSGLEARSQELEQQIVNLEKRLKDLSIQESEMETLKRDVQIAEAVFSSTLTQLDMSKSKIFATYPQIQVITPPHLPEEASSPKKLFAILGAGMSSVFLTTGFISLWLRDRHLQKMKQQEHHYQQNGTGKPVQAKPENSILISNR